jgi:hypothetical protein
MWFGSLLAAPASAAELSLPADVAAAPWQEELARVEAALPMPASASIGVGRSARGGWVVTMDTGDAGCAIPPFEIPSGPGEIRSVLWVAAAQLRAAECAPVPQLPPPPAPRPRPEPVAIVPEVPEAPETLAPALPVPPPPAPAPAPAPEVAAVPPLPVPVPALPVPAPALPVPLGPSVRLGGGAVLGTGVSFGGELFLAAVDRPWTVELRGSAARLRTDATYRAFGFDPRDRTVAIASTELDQYPGPFGRPWSRPAGDLTLSGTWGAPLAVGLLARLELRPERPGSAWRPWPGVGATGRLVLVERRVLLGLRVDAILEPVREERLLVVGGTEYEVRSPWLLLLAGVDVGWIARQRSPAPDQR